MRLKVKQRDMKVHQDLVSCVCWTPNGELLSSSDDQTLQRWAGSGEPQGRVCQVPSPATTSMEFQPSSVSQQQSAVEIFALATADGKLLLMNRSGRVEKTVDAHKGATISMRWSNDGQAICTGGEDGLVKVWSRVGMFRSTLAESRRAVYALAWSPDSGKVAYTSGKDIVIKPLQPGAKQTSWVAHDGIVLAVDWSSSSGLIATGAEDGRYKVWDAVGRLIYQCAPAGSPVTALRWAPSGALLAVATFNAVQLCDRSGWPHGRHRMDVGNVYSVAWTSDGTQLACAGGNGHVAFAEVVGMCVEQGAVSATLESGRLVRVTEVDESGGREEELEYRDRVVQLSLGAGHMVVATTTQLYVYAAGSWATPQIIDVKGIVTIIVQAEHCFLTVDHFAGLRLYGYDGRQLCQPRLTGLLPELLSAHMLALSSDTLAVVDPANPKVVRLFDASVGKELGRPLEMLHDVRQVSLSQQGPAHGRMLSIVDANGELWVARTTRRDMVKLATVCTSSLWHDRYDALAAVVDERLTVWWRPAALFVDRDLNAVARHARDDKSLGQGSELVDFSGTRCSVRRQNGVNIAVGVPPFAGKLYALVGARQWHEATRLARFANDRAMWAVLASLALEARELNVAEAAFAGLGRIDRVEFIQRLKKVPSDEGRAAELAVLAREIDKGEQILLQAGLVYRAIELRMSLFRWEEALDLALHHKTHIDTVLLRRAEFNRAARLPEQSPKFIQYAESVPIEPEAIEAKIQEELEAEAARPGARFA
ncbi:unnamed protein product [Pedinophyceae sp. YPF-701]|nr:unnamed protein product [Pedinophyceae sp. YPF-701]